MPPSPRCSSPGGDNPPGSPRVAVTVPHPVRTRGATCVGNPTSRQYTHSAIRGDSDRQPHPAPEHAPATGVISSTTSPFATKVPTELSRPRAPRSGTVWDYGRGETKEREQVLPLCASLSR